jgi:hypothetical protein
VPVAPERLGALLAAALLSLVPAASLAQGRLAEARAAFDAAEFETALSRLDALDAAEDLSFEEVCGLLVLRAEVHLALGDDAAMQADLLGLVTIAPDATLPRTAPPELREAAERMRRREIGAPTVRAEARPTATGVELRARASGDDAGLVRRVRVRARGTDGTWREATDELDVTGTGADYWAAAIGPGGWVLATSGTESDPLRWGTGSGRAREDTLVLGLAIAGASAGLVLLTVIVGVAVTSSPGDRTQPTLPVVVSF